MNVDFHMHSTFSDGTYTPVQLLEEAQKARLKAVALTDHDEIDGLTSMLSVDQNEVHIITGCEFSGNYKGKDIHILGYRFDMDNESLKEFIAYVKEKRRQRIEEIIYRCQKEGYHITVGELERAFPNTRAYGRPHVAELLINRGYAENVQDAFDRILYSGSPCYVPKVKIAVPDIVELIHGARGLAVLAHPKLIRNDGYAEELLGYGFDGIEVYHSKHTRDDELRYLHMAEKYKKIVTGGSDFHGIPHRYPYRLGEYSVNSSSVSQFLDILGI